jgi:hypothetical protein
MKSSGLGDDVAAPLLAAIIVLASNRDGVLSAWSMCLIHVGDSKCEEGQPLKLEPSPFLISCTR